MHIALIESAYKESRERGRAISKEVAEFICEEVFSLRAENARLKGHFDACNSNDIVTPRTTFTKAREALELVAAPKRADGTYNRCREACEQLARAAVRDIDAVLGKGEAKND